MKEFGLDAEIRCADAESLPYDSREFDFVWSWGVIHHSARTARIVREISRVLKPQGEARVMVYNREARIVRLALLRYYILGGEFICHSPMRLCGVGQTDIQLDTTIKNNLRICFVDFLKTSQA